MSIWSVILFKYIQCIHSTFILQIVDVQKYLLGVFVQLKNFSSNPRLSPLPCTALQMRWFFDIFRCQPQIGWNLASETSRAFATKKVKDGNFMESSKVKLQLTRRTCWVDFSLIDLNYLHSQLFVSRNAILMDHPIYYVCLARPGPSQTTSKLLWHWNGFQNWCNDFIMGACKPSSSLLRSILPLTDHLSSSQAWGSSDASACALPWWTASHDIGMLRHTSLAYIHFWPFILESAIGWSTL